MLWAFRDIQRERKRQDDRFGDQTGRTEAEWGLILAEEYGEAMTEANDMYFLGDPREAALRVELVQMAAVAVAWIEALDRRFGS